MRVLSLPLVVVTYPALVEQEVEPSPLVTKVLDLFQRVQETAWGQEDYLWA